MRMHSISIVGGGIGGLAAALGLARLGHDVIVYERAPILAEMGAGLQLTPNAVRALSCLGLDPRDCAGVVEPDTVMVRSGHNGRLITAMPVKQATATLWNGKWYALHRAELQALLLKACEAESRLRIERNWPISQVEKAGGGFRLHHAYNDSLTADATLVIGADGLWSRVRRALGDAALPRPSLKTAWRATLPMAEAPEVFQQRSGGLWIGSDAHLVHYPIAGGTMLNIVAIIKDSWNGEGWSSHGDPKVLRQGFRLWCDEVKELLGRPSEWMRWPLVDRPAWYGPATGPITLLGDAAHPMVPFLAQGAAAALEDAATLVKEMAATPDDPQAALRRYEAARLPRVRRIQHEGRRNGDIYHLPNPLAFGRDMVMRLKGGEGLMRRYGWIYEWTP